MPVEIKELIIRAVVADTAEPSTPSSTSGRQSGGDDFPARGRGGSGPDSEALVEECVRQVLAVLQRSRER